jgi:hypothetical protein
LATVGLAGFRRLFDALFKAKGKLNWKWLSKARGNTQGLRRSADVAELISLSSASSALCADRDGSMLDVRTKTLADN